ncbi:hypothetical protein [Tessaracoccus defluvii]|uniref:hypothetical protein n=1 Tax=Tessaracoccus defluvii TaxID=1285901 RepID=UPI001D03B9E0|nr:hypothetical protein [Tessaracoccus defluvii]
MLIGIHSMVWVGEWSEKAAREAIMRTAEAGYDLIELSAVEPHKFDADLTARLLAEYGLQCSASLGLSPANDISSEDPDAVARGGRCCTTHSTWSATPAARCCAASSTGR